MIASREDPFAIQVLIQSADKILIDISKNTNKKLTMDWLEFVKPEYKKSSLRSPAAKKSCPLNFIILRAISVRQYWKSFHRGQL
jgi:hypothetical protein